MCSSWKYLSSCKGCVVLSALFSSLFPPLAMLSLIISLRRLLFLICLSLWEGHCVRPLFCSVVFVISPFQGGTLKHISDSVTCAPGLLSVLPGLLCPFVWLKNRWQRHPSVLLSYCNMEPSCICLCVELMCTVSK